MLIADQDISVWDCTWEFEMTVAVGLGGKASFIDHIMVAFRKFVKGGKGQ